ncbi:hypothetical protein T03_134 [Trichinella britovi]|uniref:Uncharacterized protein n=1 Tax=Trichinella britovi TaxID=45882 RepID=A0A0V1CKP7_TRIBR|nr:hypothetical protein T03_134 [Trichinella britovi]
MSLTAFCNTCLTALLCSSDMRCLIPGGDRTHDLWLIIKLPLFKGQSIWRCGIRLYGNGTTPVWSFSANLFCSTFQCQQ